MPFPRHDIAAINEQFARLIEGLHKPEFSGILRATIHMLVFHNNCVILGFRGDARPTILYDDVAPNQHAVQVEGYLAGPYLLDPFYQAYANSGITGVFRLRELAPDEFHRSEYYRRFYKRSEMVDEIGFLVRLHSGEFVHISIDRTSPSNFTDADLELLRTFAPLIAGAVRQQWRETGVDTGTAAEPAGGLHRQLHHAFESFGRSVLTGREAEVVKMILRGYSAKATASVLKISPGTVMNHRRSIYAKLGVRSQSELFNLFIQALSAGDGSPGADPLAKRQRAELFYLSRKAGGGTPRR